MTLPAPPPPRLPQVQVKLRCPGHPLLSFSGSSVVASDGAAGEDSNSVDQDNAGPDSEAWLKALSREIAKLRSEPGDVSHDHAGASTNGGARGVSSWRLWNALSGVVGGGASAATAAAAATGSSSNRVREWLVRC